jgi:hypothetical protein
MKRHLAKFAVLQLFSLAALGCGGGKPAESADGSKAEAPAEATASEPAASPKDSEPVAAESKPAESKPAEPAADSSGSSGPTSPRTPKDILSAPDVLFMFSFNDSDMKKVAEEKCEKSSKGDAKKNADCMAAARKKVDHDGMGFKKDKSDQWLWTTVKRNGNILITLHKVPFEFGDETKNTITIKTTGKDTGSAPSKPPAKVTFEVPNDYQIVVKDPKQGTMVYEAKIGIVGDGK